MIPAKVVHSWFNVVYPMNQRVIHMFVLGAEIGKAYDAAFTNIVDNPLYNDFQYVLTLEEDNTPPCEGLLRLQESIQSYDVVGGLYWGKGEAGRPMIYGDPNVIPRNFVPLVPIPETVQPCLGLGMGFTLFSLDMFRSGKIKRPFFETRVEVKDGFHLTQTQDIYFFERIAELGYKVACDTRVRVGHLDYLEDRIW